MLFQLWTKATYDTEYLVLDLSISKFNAYRSLLYHTVQVLS